MLLASIPGALGLVGVAVLFILVADAVERVGQGRPEATPRSGLLLAAQLLLRSDVLRVARPRSVRPHVCEQGTGQDSEETGS